MNPQMSPEKAAAFLEILESPEFKQCMKNAQETREQLIAEILAKEPSGKDPIQR